MDPRTLSGHQASEAEQLLAVLLNAPAPRRNERRGRTGVAALSKGMRYFVKIYDTELDLHFRRAFPTPLQNNLEFCWSASWTQEVVVLLLFVVARFRVKVSAQPSCVENQVTFSGGCCSFVDLADGPAAWSVRGQDGGAIELHVMHCGVWCGGRTKKCPRLLSPDSSSIEPPCCPQLSSGQPHLRHCAAATNV